MSRTKLAVVTCGVLCLAVAPAYSGKPIPPDQFDKLRAVIRPGKDEDKWDLIPWQTSLWEARKLAAEKGKPLLLWEMDGHPLGCT
jgi:hypothetical protein